jgi:hypothetical protein
MIPIAATKVASEYIETPSVRTMALTAASITLDGAALSTVQPTVHMATATDLSCMPSADCSAAGSLAARFAATAVSSTAPTYGSLRLSLTPACAVASSIRVTYTLHWGFWTEIPGGARVQPVVSSDGGASWAPFMLPYGTTNHEFWTVNPYVYNRHPTVVIDTVHVVDVTSLAGASLVYGYRFFTYAGDGAAYAQGPYAYQRAVATEYCQL